MLTDVILSGGPLGGYVIFEWDETEETKTIRGNVYRLDTETKTGIFVGLADA